MSDPLLRVVNLEKRFPIDRRRFVQACHEVSFEVGEAETLGLVGESGSGKTTLGRCVLRLIEPTAGEIWFQGRRIDTLTPAQFRPYRAKLQIVFQEPFASLNPRMTVYDTLAEPLALHGMSDRSARSRRVTELLDQVGLLTRFSGARPTELSGGMQQRVAIARALAVNPEFVVLDEPTSSLPPDAESRIIKLLQDLKDELRLSYLFISHDISLVRHFCDRVAVMYLSQIVESGAKEQVFKRPQHPYSRSLLDSVLHVDTQQRRRSCAVKFRLHGEIPSPVDLPQGCYLASRCPLAKERCHSEPQHLQLLGTEGHQVRCWRIAQGDLVPAELSRMHMRRSDEGRDSGTLGGART